MLSQATTRGPIKKGITKYVIFVAQEQTLTPKGKDIKEKMNTANINIESLRSNVGHASEPLSM